MGGFFSSGSRQTQTTSPSPSTEALNQFILDELRGGLAYGGGLGRFVSAQPQLFTLRPDEEQFRQLALQRALALQDPTAYRKAGQQFFESIAAPQTANFLTAAGLGRSGAIGEALAQGGASIALPLFQQSQQAALQGLALGAQAAGLPRELELEDFLRAQSLYGSLLGGAPAFRPTGGTTTIIGSQTPSPFQVITGLGGLALGGYSAFPRTV
jgi:hypothetical protein